jgi:dienelactone hydrolase
MKLRFAVTLLVAAARAAGPGIVIDGHLDDPLWHAVTAQSLGQGGGEIRTAVAGEYLYVGARLPEPEGRVSARSVGRNPVWENQDTLRIAAGERILLVNPFGAYSVEKPGPVVLRSEPTYPYSDEREAPVVERNAEKFLVAAALGENGWTVEAAIPLSELNLPASGIVVNVERIRAIRPASPEVHWAVRAEATRLSSTVDRPALRPDPIGNNESPLIVGRVSTIPPLDSGFGDAAWSHVPVWQLLQDHGGGLAPRYPTELKILHNDRTIAILARCVEPEALIARAKRNDEPLSQDDSFHVYLATTGSSYVQIGVNPKETVFDVTGKTGSLREARPTDWNSGARVLVRREKGAWIARIDIPLGPVAKALGETGSPTHWRALFVRLRPGRDGEVLQKSVLPVIQSETAICPLRYRRLELSNSAGGALPTPQPTIDVRVLSPDERKSLDLPAMLRTQQQRRALEILKADKREWDRVRTRHDWESYRDPRIKALAASLGGFPARVPLQVRILKEQAGEGYRRQDLAYQSRAGVWVTANLYVPTTGSRPMPGIVIIHSHHRPRTQDELQDMGILWARSGCVVLIPDMPGHGERLATYPWNREGYHSRYILAMQLYLAGDSLMTWIVWDVMRGVDLLLARKDINPKQIVLLGAVAAGGDPAAVTAALDARIAAVVPFNFGEASPEDMSSGRQHWLEGLANPGWGSWESTRNLRRSIADRFLPWVICASVAPRRFVYSYELGWNVEDTSAWGRYRKVFGWYGALDNLDEAHGSGKFPGPGECANIGPSQRQSLYPKLKRWFGIPVPPTEPQDRRPEAELWALNAANAAELKVRPIHEVVRESAKAQLKLARAELAKLAPAARRAWLRDKYAAKLGDVQPNRQPQATTRWKKNLWNSEVEALTLTVEPGIIVPLLLLRPAGSAGKRLPVVVAVSEGGKESLLTNRQQDLQALLERGKAVCLPDVRGTGETSPDSRRGPESEEISAAGTELMFGNTLVGARLKDLRTVLAWMETRSDLDAKRMAVWGDSPAPPNPMHMLFDEAPNWQMGPQIEQQAEPLGGLLAVLAGLYEDKVRAIAVQGGLIGFFSVLEDRFVYVPGDTIVPGILECGDIAELIAALAPRPILLQGLVDGRNRPVHGQERVRQVSEWLNGSY